ncbi:High-affinity nickel-transporter [Sulfitobacter noctilucicola]|uniref:Nickel/cobalt efflux system n=1 Tax=Sulfitobacter noctilucicola TaxID=1342301 RepID=A0A7W6M4R5_9RHOB|nr:membrane protein [Sulfitobacter noctilucicola]KIN63050.1 High-affinity nickel-transporter [Sulfitobacter noctilucicola]MBB4172423.1 ABC-type nickel/cobalt efflux system permease component RcnA [Sulfitobacter noctilucicola]
MRYFLSFAALCVLALLGWFWLAGGFDRLGFWAAGQQRDFQNAIAGALRQARAGEVGAVTALLTACFAYGLAHAAGPGHGKVLIGGYGIARQVPMVRLSLIALAASLGQAVMAVALVYAGVLVLNLGRKTMVQWTEAVMAPVSYGAIAIIGLWLMWRGLRSLMRQQSTASEVHDHDHHGHDHQGHGDVCSSCGHKHGPTLDEVDQVSTLREALVLIAGIAIRPCTGALFVLIITWQMGIGELGIAGAFAMAFGTALVTVMVGLAAGSLRGGMLAGLGGSLHLARAVAMVEVLAGLVVVILAGGLLLRAI